MSEIKTHDSSSELSKKSTSDSSSGPSSEVKSKRDSELNSSNGEGTQKKADVKKAETDKSSESKEADVHERDKPLPVENSNVSKQERPAESKPAESKPEKDKTREQPLESKPEAKSSEKPSTEKDKTREQPLESKPEAKSSEKPAPEKDKTKEQPLESKPEAKDSEKASDGYSSDKVKFTGKNFDALEKSAGDKAYKEAYDDAIKNKKTESEARADADKASNDARRSIAEKKDSFAKFSDENRTLKHANAEGEKAQKAAELEGKSDKEAQKAYNNAFRSAYVDDYGKNAYNKAIKEGKSKEDADIAKSQAEQVAAERTKGNAVNRITPGSKYYDEYDKNSKDNVVVGHGSAFNDKNVYNYSDSKSSPDSRKSVNLSEDNYVSARDARKSNSLDDSNNANLREKVEFNNKTDADHGSKDVYGISGKSSPRLAEQANEKTQARLNQMKDTDGQGFNPQYSSNVKRVGGGNQIASVGGNFENGGLKRITERDSNDKIRAKEDYLNDLYKHCNDENVKKIDPTEKWERVSGSELDDARSKFDRDRSKLINEWEQANGKSWPTYSKDIYNENGNIIRHAGDKYDAHHIRPLCMGGRNTCDNIVPLHYEDHIGKNGIHNEASYDSLYKKYSITDD